MINDGTEEEDDQQRFLRSVATNNASPPHGAQHRGDENKADGEKGQINVLNRVPSQKLSVLIKRKNTAMKKERRRLEKEQLLKSQMDSENLDDEDVQMAPDLLRLNSGANQSERTIQAIKNTSQMILPTERNP